MKRCSWLHLTAIGMEAAVILIVVTAHSSYAETRNCRMLCVSKPRTGVADRRVDTGQDSLTEHSMIEITHTSTVPKTSSCESSASSEQMSSCTTFAR